MRRDAIRALFALGLLFTTFLGECAIPAVPTDPLAVLLDLINQRLAVSEDVARSKWNSGTPVEDPAREREIVTAIGAQAAGYSLDPEFARNFFRAQIEASKIVQHARIAQWRDAKQAPFSGVPDLQRDIRPQLDRLTTELLTALAKAQPALRAPGSEARLAAHASDAARAAALAPLRQTRPN